MDIQIQSLHFKASEQLQDFIREKVGKLISHNDSIIRAEVTLSQGGSGDPENQYCEITLFVPGYNYFAKKNAATYETAITRTVHAVHEIMRRAKD